MSTSTNFEFNPFSEAYLAEILKIDNAHPDRLISRENTRLEFKENYNWNSHGDYFKTIAAFANRNGGYLIFGIKNKPHEIAGMTNTNFEAQDPARFSSALNSAFNPDIRYEKRIVELNGRTLGIIFTNESETKPIICSKTIGNAIFEGEIYYRYGGYSQKIHFSELQQILNAIRKQERDSFSNILKKIGKIGVQKYRDPRYQKGAHYRNVQQVFSYR